MSMPNRWRSDITDVFKSNEICWMKQQNKDHRRGRENSIQQKVGAKTATIKSCRTIYGETTSLVCEHSFTRAQKNEKYQVWETEKIRLNLMLKTGSDNVRYIPILNKIHECPWFFIFHFWFGEKNTNGNLRFEIYNWVLGMSKMYIYVNGIGFMGRTLTRPRIFGPTNQPLCACTHLFLLYIFDKTK